MILVAQDLTYYGKDLYQKPSLYNLLLELTKNTSFDWIRLHYTYPQYFSDELIDLIASTPNICKYIDLPIQHISDNVLKLMRRGTSKKSIIQLIEKLRKRIPELHIRTTVIIGHPGETKRTLRNWLILLKLIGSKNLEHLFIHMKIILTPKNITKTIFLKKLNKNVFLAL